MIRKLAVLVAASAVTIALVGVPTRAQEAPQKILRGAEQPNQNKWNAKSPWGKTERSAPLSLIKKDPFKVFDNVWYVGFQTVSTYLVSTSAGPVLIDAGYAQTSDWLLENIRKAGFDPAQIKYVFVTHSHLDHFGGAPRIKQISGARVGLSALDWDQIERQQASAPQNFPALARDLVLKDNDAIAVGDTTFKFYFTPGHTPGATSVEFPVKDLGKTYRAVTPGGLGLQYPAQVGPQFKSSIQRLRQLGPWDAVLGNHPFLGPIDLEQVEAELKLPYTTHNPALVGPTAANEFFDAILTIVDEKLVAEPPDAARPPASR